MNSFQNFFEKFNKILAAPHAQKKPIIELINQRTHILLTEKELDIRNFIVYLNVSSAVKNEIYLHKQKLLEALKAEGTSIVDIR